ncbi:MAG: heavy-metal-associated domain-containing protein [bacterium]
MATYKFKTSLKCNGCIQTITPFLNNAGGIEHWEVDLNDPDRILIVESFNLTEAQVKEVINKAGYTAEAV